MKCIFCSCSSLTDINLSNFNTKNVTDISFMFDKCSSLKKLNLSYLNANNLLIRLNFPKSH